MAGQEMTIGELVDEIRRMGPETLIEAIRSRECELDNGFLYTAQGDDRGITARTRVHLGEFPEIDDDNTETMPGWVIAAGLEPLCAGNLLVDVVLNAFHQDPAVSNETIARAFEHYLDKDSFLPIQPSGRMSRSMEKLDEGHSFPWQLFKEGDRDLILSVLCGGIGLYERRVALDAKQRLAYETLSSRALDDLALRLMRDPE